ncbi:MAG: hypothetical protein ABSB19_13080 [Methylomonas sp.]|jgi:hypothetical protein
MKLENAFNSLDKLFNDWFKIDINEEFRYYSRINTFVNKTDVLYDANIIDNKCSALLTHISIMFIVLGIFINGETHNGIVFFLLVLEFIAYILAAMSLLRCVDIMGPPFRQLPEAEEEIKQAFLYEITIRRGVYVRVLRIVFILTAILIPIMLLKYFL